MRFWLLLALLLSASSAPVLATETTRSALQTQNNSAITTNGAGQISGSALNSLLGNIIDSSGNLQSDNAWSGTNVFNGPVLVPGGGLVTSVGASFTGGLISVAGSPIVSSGTLAFTIAGTSGGIPYFASSTGWASSDVLAANAIVIGGGAGLAPSTTATGTGVLTALASAVNADGGIPKLSGSLTSGHCLSWSAGGVTDSGASCGSGTGVASTYVNVTDNTYGDEATGDCATDDGPAINALITAVPDGTTIFFPPASGGCYAIATQIDWPTTKTISFLGTGSGESSTSRLQASGAIGAVIAKADSFTRGGSIQSLVIDAHGLAADGINFAQAASFLFQDLTILDGTNADMEIGDGVANTQEIRLVNIRMGAEICELLTACPQYNLIFQGTDSFATNIILANAQQANLLEYNSGGNFWSGIHGYNYLSGASPYQMPVYNFEVSGYGSSFVGWAADGSTTANVRIEGYQIKFASGTAQFDSVTAQTCILVDNGLTGVTAINNTLRGCSLANSVRQDVPGIIIAFFNWVDSAGDFDNP